MNPTEIAYDMAYEILRCGCTFLPSGCTAGAPPPDAGMSLREAVNYALEHSPDLKSAQAEIRSREGLATTAHSFLMPQVDLSGDAGHSRFEHGYPAGTPPSLLRFDTTLYTAGADLKYLAWDFHKTELELDAARERVAVARAAVDRRRQEIIFETARLYLQSQANTELIGKLLPSFPANAPSPGNAATDWFVGVHISFPLFDGGRRKGQIEAAQAQPEEARLGRRQLELRIGREVRTALADLESAQGRVRALRNSVAESDQVLHDAQLKFEAGRSVINFVLDVESALLTSQFLLSQAERSASIANLALDFRTGRIDLGRLPDR